MSTRELTPCGDDACATCKAYVEICRQMEEPEDCPRPLDFPTLRPDRRSQRLQCTAFAGSTGERCRGWATYGRQLCNAHRGRVV